MIRTEILLDQINSDNWSAISDYIFSVGNHSYFEKIKATINPNIKLFSNPSHLPERAVILCGSNQNINECFSYLPNFGEYILITRDNDTSITPEIFDRRPKSIKHWFAINCAVTHPEITAIPVGLATSGGQNNTIIIEADTYKKRPVQTRIYSRLTVTPKCHARFKALEINEHNPLCKIVTTHTDAVEFYHDIIDHEFVLAPVGEGADCLRMAESIALGSIPICTDCEEIRNIANNLPVIFTKDYIFTNEWLDEQKKTIEGKAIESLTMSYWIKKVEEKKQQLWS